MTGNVQKRYGHWRVVLELGEQAALRCPTCRSRHWSEDEQPSTCPADHGEPEGVVARRQEMLPAKFTTKKLAEAAMRDALHERLHGDYVAPVDLTVGEYLKRWLLALEVENLSPNTLLAYDLHVKRISAHVGRLPLQQFGRADVGVLAVKMASEVGARGRVLSPATRRAVLVTLHHALGDAVHEGLLRTNPAHGVSRPKVRQAEMHTWSRDELKKFLDATTEDRLAALWRLMATTGLRRGEALGLKWSDADLVAGGLSIQRSRVATGYEVTEREPKTGRGRSVPIDAGTVAALRSWKRQQAAERLQWGQAWQNTGHVFTRENGEPWHPDRVRVLFQEAVKAAGVPRIRMHDLRHGWATLALRAGIHPKVVQERLGHANIAMTMDRYSHVIPALQESAAELVASIVDGNEG